VQLVISDQHAGLVAAIKRCLQGAAHQRCRVHLARNLLAMIPKREWLDNRCGREVHVETHLVMGPRLPKFTRGD
jgi:transposase-like protein